MEDKNFAEELNSVCVLAREIRNYAATSWKMLSHRPRRFLVSYASMFAYPEKDMLQTKTVVMWMYTDERSCFLHVGFSSRLLGLAYYRYNPYSYLNPTEVSEIGFYRDLLIAPNHQLVADLRRLYKDDAAAIQSLRAGLNFLFNHVDEECARCAREFASEESVRQEQAYKRQFIERTNKGYLLDCLSAALRRIYDLAEGRRGESKSAEADLLEITSNAVRLIGCAQKATKEQKLFITDCPQQ